MTNNAKTIDTTHDDPDTAADDGGEEVVDHPKERGASSDDEARAVPPGRTWRRPGLPKVTWSRAATGLVVIVALSATVVAIVLGMKLQHNSDVKSAGQEALQTAEEYAVVLTSVDTQNLDRDFARVLDGATGEFKDMYSSSSAQLRQLLVDNQATGSGTVIDAGIKSQSQDKVEILLFVDQSITNIASPDPRIDRSRIVMTMERVDGRWLASKVELP